jgi:hypothetical protein
MTDPGTHHHITSHHTTSPHHSVSSGVESQVEHVRFLGLGAGTNTNTNTIPNDGNDILAKCRRKSHQRRTVLLTVRLVFECVPTIGSSTRAH